MIYEVGSTVKLELRPVSLARHISTEVSFKAIILKYLPCQDEVRQGSFYCLADNCQSIRGYKQCKLLVIEGNNLWDDFSILTICICKWKFSNIKEENEI